MEAAPVTVYWQFIKQGLLRKADTQLETSLSHGVLRALVSAPGRVERTPQRVSRSRSVWPPFSRTGQRIVSHLVLLKLHRIKPP